MKLRFSSESIYTRRSPFLIVPLLVKRSRGVLALVGFVSSYNEWVSLIKFGTFNALDLLIPYWGVFMLSCILILGDT